METVRLNIIGVWSVSFFPRILACFRQLSSRARSRKNATLSMCEIPHHLWLLSNISFSAVCVFVRFSKYFSAVRHNW